MAFCRRRGSTDTGGGQRPAAAVCICHDHGQQFHGGEMAAVRGGPVRYRHDRACLSRRGDVPQAAGGEADRKSWVNMTAFRVEK